MFFIFVICWQVLSCTQVQDKDSLSGSVVAIADGDTFTLLTSNKEQVKVRLHGIDCPERRQDFGQVARQKLSELVFNKNVRIEKKDVDRYGRTIAIVYDEQNRCINEELLKAGLAWHYTAYDQNPEWAALERGAREKRLGLWSHNDPVAPWEWRKKGKKATADKP